VVATPRRRLRPRRFAKRVTEVLLGPTDLLLSLRVGWFIWRVPHCIARTPLPALLDSIRAAPRPRRPQGVSSREFVLWFRRLRRPWFRLPALRGHDTCYVRALTLYRFFDPGDAALQFHLVVEPGERAEDRLRGHAWCTLDGEVLEERDLNRAGRSTGLYTHPHRVSSVCAPASDTPEVSLSAPDLPRSNATVP